MNPKGQKVRVPRYRVHGMRQPPHADHENSHTKNTKAEPTNAMRRMDRMSFISTAFYVVDPNETIDTTPPIHRTHHWWFLGQHKPDRIKVSLRSATRRVREPALPLSTPTTYLALVNLLTAGLGLAAAAAALGVFNGVRRWHPNGLERGERGRPMKKNESRMHAAPGRRPPCRMSERARTLRSDLAVCATCFKFE